MEQLKALAALSEQRKLRDLAAHAAALDALWHIDNQIAQLRVRMKAETTALSPLDTPAQQAHIAFVQHAEKCLARLQEQRGHAQSTLEQSRQEARRSAGRQQAIDILRSRAAALAIRAADRKAEEQMAGWAALARNGVANP